METLHAMSLHFGAVFDEHYYPSGSLSMIPTSHGGLGAAAKCLRF